MTLGGISWGKHNDFYESMIWDACPLLGSEKICQKACFKPFIWLTTKVR